jgi:hypothetical protein
MELLELQEATGMKLVRVALGEGYDKNSNLLTTTF